jgi:hypothetical protein
MMTMQDLNFVMLISIYSIVTHWECMWASFDIVSEDVRGV